MIIFWAITPLQSAIFGTSPVTRVRDIQMITTAAVMPLTSQVSSLNADFLMTAYGISWLDQKLPAFTTKSFAILPFAPVQADATASTSETWIASADAYSTNLDCTTAKYVAHGHLTYDFDNEKGCSISGVALPSAQSRTNLLVYVGYYDDAHVDWALQNPNCSVEFSNTFLAIWASGDSQTTTGQYQNMTALFCQPVYTVRDITVKVNATDHSVVEDDFNSTTPNYGMPRPMPSEVLNLTNFHYLIGTGVTEKTQITDYPNTRPVEQFPRLYQSDLTWPSTNMVGYGVAAAGVSVDGLGDPFLLQSTFTKAHQLLFATAFNSLLQPIPPEAVIDTKSGYVQDQPTAIILVRVFSVVVEVFLCLVSLMAATIWYMSARRTSQMVRDPSRIGDIMSMVSECRGLKDIFRDMGTTSREQLNDRLRYKKFRLRGLFEHRPPVMHLEILQSEYISTDEDGTRSQSLVGKAENIATSFRPVELRIRTAILFILTLALSLTGLIFLNILTLKRGGMLPLPDDCSWANIEVCRT
jgi:hypothetical protein